MGEEVTDWLGGAGVLLISGCDVVVGAIVPAAIACDVIVSLLTNCVDETFVKKDDDRPDMDDTNPVVEFEENVADIRCVAKELNGDTENGDAEFAEIPRKKS